MTSAVMSMNLYEIVGSVLGLLGVILMVREQLWSWPVGIVSVACYVVVFYQARLYADSGLQVCYVFLQAYGWYHWRYGGKSKDALTVTRAPVGELLLSLGGGALFAGCLGYLLARFTDQALSYWDSTIAAYSLVAQLMQARKRIENWLVWVAVNALAVGVYTVKALYLTSILYAVFLGLAVWGYFSWKQSLRGADLAVARR